MPTTLHIAVTDSDLKLIDAESARRKAAAGGGSFSRADVVRMLIQGLGGKRRPAQARARKRPKGKRGNAIPLAVLERRLRKLNAMVTKRTGGA